MRCRLVLDDDDGHKGLPHTSYSARPNIGEKKLPKQDQPLNWTDDGLVLGGHWYPFEKGQRYTVKEPPK